MGKVSSSLAQEKKFFKKKLQKVCEANNLTFAHCLKVEKLLAQSLEADWK